MRSFLLLPAVAHSAISVLFIACPTHPALAQLTPDNTLDSESSIVTGGQTIKDLPADLIQGGATRGSNLFHSFLEFNVNEGQRVYFDNPTGIDRILSRVTGSDVSNILGTLGVNGGADLFFLNSNGIVFGPSAWLDLNGSFTASTAESVVFDNGFHFSTVESNAPPLLTINVPIGLQVGQNPGSIQNFSRSLNSANEVTGLTVGVNHHLTFLGGDLIIDGGSMTAPSGLIQLIAVKAPSDLFIPITNSQVEINSNSRYTMGNILLSNASLDASGQAAGYINLYGNDITVQSGSTINAITQGNGIGKGIYLNAIGDIDLTGSSSLNSENYGIGQGGNLSIKASDFKISDQSFISSMTFGTGAAGNLSIQILGDISIVGNSYDILQNVYFLGAFSGRLAPTTRTAGIFLGTAYNGGQGGNLFINSRNLTLSSGAIILNSTFGNGDLGEVNIFIEDFIDINQSALIAPQLIGSSGSGNILTVTSNQLILSNGGYVIITNLGNGSPGNISIQSQDINILSKPINVIVTPGIISAAAFSNGNSGNILINTNNLIIKDGGQITSQSGTIELADIFKLSEFLNGGSAGNITINATGNIFLSGVSASGITNSAISAETYSNFSAGNIQIRANNLTLQNQAEIQGATGFNGTAGNITIDSNTLNISHQAKIISATSGISSDNSILATGRGGNITINTGYLNISDLGEISVASRTAGDGGNLNIFSDDIRLSGGSLLSADTTASGKAGIIDIQAQNISLQDGAQINAQTSGSGNGGSIQLTAQDQIELVNASEISASTTNTGNAGDIILTSQYFSAKANSNIRSNTFSSGSAGNISLNIAGDITLDTGAIEALTTEGSTGNGGDIFIDPITTTLTNSRIALDSQGNGVGGSLQLISNFLHLDRSEISASTAGSDGGSLTLHVPQLLTLRNNSVISTQAGKAGAGGNGGNIAINSKLIVGSGNSDIIANAFEGNGGNINVVTEGLFGFTVENTDTPRTNLTNDITASSRFGVSSTPNISQSLDPSRSLAVLDANVTDLSNQIDRRCDLVGTTNASSFVMTGKGGLPPNNRNRISLHPLWTALDLRENSPDPGENFYRQGQYSEAIDSWENALPGSETELEQHIWYLTNLAQTYAIQGDWSKATQAIEEGFSRLNPNVSRGSGLLPQLLSAQSYLLTEQGKLDQALNLSTQASELYQAQNDRSGLLQTQINQAQILTRQGNLRQALAILTTAQEQITENAILTAAIELELGTVHRLLGNYTAAETALERSVTLFSKTNPLHYAAALLALGDNDRDQFVPLNRQFNNRAEQIALVPLDSRGEAETRAGEIIASFNTFSNQALTHYREVQAIAPTPDLRVQALTQEFLMTIDLTKSRVATGSIADWSAVESLRQKLQAQLSELPNSSTHLYSRLNLAEGIFKLQTEQVITVTPKDLQELLTQTLQDTRTLGDQRAEVQALSQLATFYEQQQQWNTAQQPTEAALTLAQANGETDLVYRLFWQLGRLEYAQGNPDKAIAAYRNSIQALNTLQSDLSSANTNIRFAFRDTVDPIYREMVSLLLDQDTPETPHPENVIQARNLIESLQLSELVNFFQADCDVSNLAQIDELDPHSAVIYPIILSDRLEVIVSLPGKPLRHYSSPISQANLTQGMYLIQRELTNPLSRRYLPLTRRLYDAIIRPIEADLGTNDIENLVFVLDGPLRNLPMSILHDGEQFLIEKYAIAVTPGLQLLDPQPLQQQKLTALVGGLTQARQGFSALPNVQAEVASITGSIPSDVLLDDRFVERNLTTEISGNPFPIVHLATHGEFGSTAEDTYVLTWNDRFDANEFSTLLQSRTANRPIELLILSACRTAAGDDRAALGLAGIAVRSGARSTLASLWYINDEATSVLMGKLYEFLSQQNMTKAEAVRQAQLELLRDPQYANPYYWAPFVLVGNWL